MKYRPSYLNHYARRIDHLGEHTLLDITELDIWNKSPEGCIKEEKAVTSSLWYDLILSIAVIDQSVSLMCTSSTSFYLLC